MTSSYLRSLTVMLSLSAFGATPGAEANRPVDEEMRCIKRLELPPYTPIARAARNTGLVRAGVVVGVKGEAAWMKITGPDPWLEEEVRNHLGRSEFQPSCTGKETVIEFVFILDGEPVSVPPIPRIQFVAPNRFVIESRPVQASIDYGVPRPNKQ